jgi:hypothetical protein
MQRLLTCTLAYVRTFSLRLRTFSLRACVHFQLACPHARACKACAHAPLASRARAGKYAACVAGKSELCQIPRLALTRHSRPCLCSDLDATLPDPYGGLRKSRRGRPVDTSLGTALWRPCGTRSSHSGRCTPSFSRSRIQQVCSGSFCSSPCGIPERHRRRNNTCNPPCPIPSRPIPYQPIPSRPIPVRCSRQSNV